MDKATLARAIAAAAGREPADLVIGDVDILDVITGAVTRSDVAIVGERIVGTHASYEGKRRLDGRGLTCVPGFVDTHVHVESSLVTPLEFDRCVVAHGVTTAICDPHEIANVLGLAGIRYLLDASERTVLDLRVQLSSCVPSTGFETTGAALSAADLVPLSTHPKVIGLAEVMNYPGVLACKPDMLDKLTAFQDGHIDGHAPLLSGRDLNAYLAARIRTDHEATSAAEAYEKLAKGMAILIREGSVSKDLDALAEVLDADTASFLALCTDDRNPLDIGEEGHLDFMIRRLIAKGRPRHAVYRAASWSGANAFGLRDRGLVAPGWRADLVLVEDLDACRVADVIVGGRRVEDTLFADRPPLGPVGLESVQRAPVRADDFRIVGGDNPAPVIGVTAGRIITERLAFDMSIDGGEVSADLAQDVIKCAVVARYGKNENIGRGLVHGFGLKRGAIASSVGHDSHNIIVVGVDDSDIAAAVNRVIAMQGGFVVAAGGEARAELALPVAGLMSVEPFEAVRSKLIELRVAAQGLGCILPEPFLQVAFLPLPVIPHLKITDKGLFDVDRFQLVGWP